LISTLRNDYSEHSCQLLIEKAHIASAKFSALGHSPKFSRMMVDFSSPLFQYPARQLRDLFHRGADIQQVTCQRIKGTPLARGLQLAKGAEGWGNRRRPLFTHPIHYIERYLTKIVDDAEGANSPSAFMRFALEERRSI
jgi:hypothetical protein